MPAFPEYVLAFIATTLTVTLAIYAWKHRGVAGALAITRLNRCIRRSTGTLVGSCLGLALLLACSPIPSMTPDHPSPSPTEAAAPGSLPSQTSTLTSQPTQPPATLATKAPPSTPTPEFSVCSPLDGFGLQDIPGSISNPYHPPAEGKDDPHAGIDLADRSPNSQVALKGRGVQAVLPGQVAGVIKDRFPYGNAVIIESQLEDLPAEFVAGLSLPEPAPPFEGPIALTCPQAGPLPAWDQPQRSLYLLYAHLDAAPSVNPGDSVSCGQSLGQVGDTGNALNPHLHLEARTGPAGWRFASLAHYDNSASTEEMASYCSWAVSGILQVFDPMSLFK